MPITNEVRWLKRYGYLPDVKLSELDKLDESSSVLRASLRQLQSAVYSVEQIGYPDGVLGDRTRAAMTQVRCAHPDFPDEEFTITTQEGLSKIQEALGIGTDEAKDLINMHLGLMNARRSVGYIVGSGSWPQPCQKEGITVNWDTSRAPRGLDTDRLFDRVAKAYRDIGANVVRQNGNSNIRVTWEVLQGSVIGLAQFNSQSCRDSIFCKLDPGYFPNFWQVCGLLQHEWGHNMNLEHTNGGVMNPSITQFSDPIVWSPNDPSYRTLVRFFGGEPIDPDDDPDPDPDVPELEGRGLMLFGNQIYDVRQTMKKV